jgi:pimeloyl-ACP methyl ester carboxylesterase
VTLAILLTPATAAADTVVPAVPWGNDFACVPSEAHPRPVILVHGLGATADTNWSYMGPHLDDAGYCVFALTYGIDPRSKAFGGPGGAIKMEESAKELKRFVRRVRRHTHARRVDLVGHSEGTVMPRYYLERLGGARRVRRFVALTPLWRGTNLGGLPELAATNPQFSAPVLELIGSFCASCPQFLPDSAYLADLNADGERIPGIRHTNIVTRYDELVTPYTSGVMRDGGKNIILQDVCPADLSEHGAVAFDPAVARMVLNALDPKAPPLAPC